MLQAVCVLCTDTLFWQQTPSQFVVINAMFSESGFCLSLSLSCAARLCPVLCIFNWVPFGLTEIFI